jgi:thioredoxin 1
METKRAAHLVAAHSFAQKTSVPRRIAGRPAALPQNCLTTEEESRITLSFRPRHFSNFGHRDNISFLHSYLAHFRNLNGAASSNTFARIEARIAGSGRNKIFYQGRHFMESVGILEITDGNFDQEVLKSDQPVMIDFWAAWCGPCKMLAPVVDEVASAYQGKVKVGKMDVDSSPATPQRYGVRGIPTLLIFKGGQVQEQIVGYVNRDVIEKALKKHVS